MVVPDSKGLVIHQSFILFILSILFEFPSYIFVPPGTLLSTSPAIGASG